MDIKGDTDKVKEGFSYWSFLRDWNKFDIKEKL